MANMCSNWVKISGDEKDIENFIDLVGEDFNFEKIIPTETEERKEAIEKWGCSSISFDTVFDKNDASWEFLTKWNAPALIYEKLREMFPNLFIYWRYEEPGDGLYGFLNDEDN